MRTHLLVFWELDTVPLDGVMACGLRTPTDDPSVLEDFADLVTCEACLRAMAAKHEGCAACDGRGWVRWEDGGASLCIAGAVVVGA